MPTAAAGAGATGILPMIVAMLAVVLVVMLVSGLTVLVVVLVPVLALDALFALLAGFLVALLASFQVLLVTPFVVVLVVRVARVLVVLLNRVVLRLVHLAPASHWPGVAAADPLRADLRAGSNCPNAWYEHVRMRVSACPPWGQQVGSPEVRRLRLRR